MVTSLSGTIVDGGSQFAVSINSTNGTAIDSSRPTWLIIHGWNSDPDRFADMVSAIRNQRPTDQILLLDWETAAVAGPLLDNPGEAEKRIPLVAAWAATALINAGFSGTNLHEIGHDFGANIAGEIAELIPGGVNTIVALNPFGNIPGNSYDPEGPNGVNFSQHSQYSWAFHDSDPHNPAIIDFHDLASRTTPITADEAFDITGGFNSSMPDLFTTFVSMPNHYITGQYFNIQRLVDHQPIPWRLDYFNADGGYSPGAGYEAVVTVTGGGNNPLSIAYIDAAASVSINDVTMNETDANTSMTFTITRAGGTAEFYIWYSISDGSATAADDDYVATGGMLRFAEGISSMTVSVTIKGDLKREPNETVLVNIYDATNGANITDFQGVGTILNDDNVAPVVSVNNAVVSATAAQSIAVASLFNVIDDDDDQLTYFLYDADAGANSGHFIVNGTIVAAQTIYALTAAELAQATFVSGARGNSDTIYLQAYDGIAYSGWNANVRVDVPINHTPVVTAPQSNVSTTAAQSFAVSTLFGASDVDGDALTYYLYDSNAAANSGHFVVGGVTVPARTIYQLTAAQFAQATFVAGAAGVADDILVQAFDGRAYSGWNTSVRVNVPATSNHAPVVTAPQPNVTATGGQLLALSNLFNAGDSDGDVLTYYIYDSNPAANSGYFVVNGTVLSAQTIHALTAAQFAQATFVAGAGGVTDNILVQAFDGKAYSGWNTSVNVAAAAPVNHAPTVNLVAGASVATGFGNSIFVPSLFVGNDSDGDALTYYLYDSNPAANSGHFVVNNVVVPAQTIYAVTADDFLHRTNFVAGAYGTNDSIYVQAFDGKAYSGWNTSVNVTVPVPVNHAPTVYLPLGAAVTKEPGASVLLGSLFGGSDADSDPLTYYVYDSNAAANSGHVTINGITVPAQTIYALSALELQNATFVAGADGTADSIYVQAFDGKAYSGWNASVTIKSAAPNNAPTVNLPSGNSAQASAGQSLQLSTLFSGSDIDGNTLSYYVYDANSAANSGHFVVGGNIVAGQTITAMTAAQLAQATFVAGDAGTFDDIYVQAFDGQLYSGWNSTVHVTAVAPNNAPTVDRPAGTNIGATAGQTLQLSSLFAGNDLDGDPLSYFVYDNNAAANGGHVEIGGNVVTAQTITAMSAAELAQATFVAGDAGTADDIFVQAFDGKAYSGWTTGVHIFV